MRGDDEVEMSRALGELRTELESTRARVTALESELESVQERAMEEATRLQLEVSRLEERVRCEREIYSALWRMNCERLLEHDEIIATKEEQTKSPHCRVRSYAPSEPQWRVTQFQVRGHYA